MFAKLFKRVGLGLDDAVNTMDLPGHVGRHIEEYHRYVFKRLQDAVGDKSGQTAADALLAELTALRAELTANPRLPYLDGGLR